MQHSKKNRPVYLKLSKWQHFPPNPLVKNDKGRATIQVMANDTRDGSTFGAFGALTWNEFMTPDIVNKFLKNLWNTAHFLAHERGYTQIICLR